ncbi:MAG: diversity-generating retroelement protein Avd [Candidatus Paceibacterota bacterium]
MYKDLIIFEKMYEFNLWLFPAVQKFPKNQRFVLGQHVQNTSLRITMYIIKANSEQDKRPHLRQISVELDTLRVLVRLSKDLRFLNTKQYEHANVRMAEIGRLLGGWMKKSGTSVP